MGFTGLEDYQCNDSVSSCSSEVSSVGSVESDLENSMEEVTSSLSSSPDFPFSYSSSPPSGQHAAGDSLNDMSSLLQQLPFKRGLSKHFQGKSQSFTCLSNVTCLEDLAKPENPYNKKLKSCKSYMGFSENPRSSSDQHLHRSASSRLISKKTSRGSCSSFINSKRNNNNGSSFNGNKPPIHPLHRSDNDSTSSFSNQTLVCMRDGFY